MTTDPVADLINRQSYIAWCRSLMAKLHDNGIWGFPSGGFQFQKRGNTLVLIARMPHDPAMPITAEQLKAQQDDLYAKTVDHFTAAGFEVRDETQEETDGDQGQA